jgi:hypothetical protein
MSDRFPYVSRETWWTAYWRLRRKLHGYELVPTDNDWRKASILLAHAECVILPAVSTGAQARSAEEALSYLTEVWEYGRQAQRTRLAHYKAKARLGAR